MTNGEFCNVAMLFALAIELSVDPERLMLATLKEIKRKEYGTRTSAALNKLDVTMKVI
jgi:hypothetical protein